MHELLDRSAALAEAGKKLFGNGVNRVHGRLLSQARRACGDVKVQEVFHSGEIGGSDSGS
jgi:hypothetical protein